MADEKKVVLATGQTSLRNIRSGFSPMRRGWSEAELRERAKGDKEKVAMAVRLRRETTMTLKWMAERWEMGSRGYLAWLLGRRNRAPKPKSCENILKYDVIIN